MSKIRGRDTKPELKLRGLLEQMGFDYQAELHFQEHDVKPDFAYEFANGEGIAVFVHGCFWHGCKEHYREPKSNVDYWRTKIERNLSRDSRDLNILKENGWSSLVIWEHSLKDLDSPMKVRDKLVEMVLKFKGGEVVEF